MVIVLHPLGFGTLLLWGLGFFAFYCWYEAWQRDSDSKARNKAWADQRAKEAAEYASPKAVADRERGERLIDYWAAVHAARAAGRSTHHIDPLNPPSRTRHG